jgi:hypothetical protein
MTKLVALKAWFEHLTPERVSETAHFYASHAYFKDPFNEVNGVDQIARIYAHMFQQVADPRFVITEIIQDADTAVLIWVFSFAAQKGSHAAAKTNASAARNSVRAERTEVRGASHLRFDSHGKIIWHRDYWDTAEELYAKIPILGAVMRFLKRRLATPQ